MSHEKRIRRRFLSAAKRGDVDAARTLLLRGAEVDAKTRYGCGLWPAKTPLMFAVERGHEAHVRFLIGRGADVNLATTIQGWTPLMLAVRKGDAPLVQFLIDNGADARAVTGEGGTALMLAVDGGHLGVVRLLIAAGADLHARRRWALGGRTALSIARFKLEEAVRALRLRESRPRHASAKRRPLAYQLSLVPSTLHEESADPGVSQPERQ